MPSEASYALGHEIVIIMELAQGGRIICTQFAWLYWYKSTNTDAEGALQASYALENDLHSVCLLYWYKSTNTDA